MALTPQNNAEFLREVNDEVRRDQVVRLWRRWGLIAVGVLLVAMIALGGWLWWRSAREAAIGLEGEQMASAVAKLEGGNTRGAETLLKSLTEAKAVGYRVAARIALADDMLVKADTKGAAAAFAAIANDASIAQPFRDLALVRQTAAEYDALKPEQVVARLKPLAISGAPWFGSAGEMVAIAYLRMGKRDLAGAMFGAMAKDKGVPDSIRSRGVQLAGVLGVEVAPIDDKNPDGKSDAVAASDGAGN